MPAEDVAVAVTEKTDAQVLFLGGNLSRESCSTLGPIAEHMAMLAGATF